MPHSVTKVTSSSNPILHLVRRFIKHKKLRYEKEYGNCG